MLEAHRRTMPGEMKVPIECPSDLLVTFEQMHSELKQAKVGSSSQRVADWLF